LTHSQASAKPESIIEGPSGMKSTSGFFCDHTLTVCTAALYFAMRQNGFITRWIPTLRLTVYQKTAITDFDMLDG
jgi:hypothetical protein